MRRLVGLAALAGGTALAAPAGGLKPGEAQNAILRGDYMAARTMLKRAAFGPDGAVLDDNAAQTWEQVEPMLTGELPRDGLSRGHPLRKPDPAETGRVRAAVARPALDEIVRRARATSIVILNEAHYSPRDRAFALEVARALRPLGFIYLAAEAFMQGPDLAVSPAIAELVASGVVRRHTGYYTNDPVFAGFIREAMRIGYRPVAYESSEAQNSRSAGIQGREDGQAENLQAFLLAHPGAKLLVHVGHGHVNEIAQRNDDGSPVYRMAARLKQLTGIDPLTIDQTTMSDLQPVMRNAYPVAAAKAGARDVVLFEGDQPLLLGMRGTDLQVVHPARAYSHGRPTWLAALGGRPVAIPPALLSTSGERLIQAFDAAAPADAVPIDQVLVSAGQPAPSLMLPHGVRVRYATQP